MFETLLVAKIVTSVTTVLALSLVAEHVSPRAAGILSGYPLGSAIALFFIGVENGHEFASVSAIYILAGLAATLVFSAGYYLGTQIFKSATIIMAPITSIILFLVASYTLTFYEQTLWVAFLAPVIAIIVFGFLFRKIENVKVKQRVKFTKNVLLFRATLSTLIVLFVTEIAKVIGPEWAGLLSAFPSTAFPLFLIIHMTYGKEQVHTIIKNYPLGIGALVVFSLTAALVYPSQGVFLGTGISFATATGYLLLYTIMTFKVIPVLKKHTV